MTIEELTKRVATLESIVEALRPVDLSDKYADFVVRKSPPKWLTSGGRDYAGCRISETNPEFCDAMSSFLDWQAAMDEDKGYSYVNAKNETVFPAKYARKDAARARAWGQRLRSQPGVTRAPQSQQDEIPF